MLYYFKLFNNRIIKSTNGKFLFRWGVILFLFFIIVVVYFAINKKKRKVKIKKKLRKKTNRQQTCKLTYQAFIQKEFSLLSSIVISPFYENQFKKYISLTLLSFQCLWSSKEYIITNTYEQKKKAPYINVLNSKIVIPILDKRNNSQKKQKKNRPMATKKTYSGPFRPVYLLLECVISLRYSVTKCFFFLLVNNQGLSFEDSVYFSTEVSFCIND